MKLLEVLGMYSALGGDIMGDYVENGYTKHKPTRGEKLKTNYEYVEVGRNDPCPCGSGKKYKKCCLDSGKYEKYQEVRRD